MWHHRRRYHHERIVVILAPPVVCIKKTTFRAAIAAVLTQIDKNNETLIQTSLQEYLSRLTPPLKITDRTH
jgi:hypothetical protein